LPHPQRDLAEAVHQADTLASSLASVASTQPAGLDAAVAQQHEIRSILNEARGRAVYRAARARLRASPTFAALLAPRVWGDADSPSGEGSSPDAGPPGIAFSAWDLLRQWGRSLPWSIQDAIEPDNAFESAGFEPALRAYFNVIGK
jgi:hypothetical protein